MAEAEEMYMRALRGYEKAWGHEHTSTLDTVNNLGLLYEAQGKMAEAEMYVRPPRGYEKAVERVIRERKSLPIIYKDYKVVIDGTAEEGRREL
jgi:Tetratricopeptide repeat